MKLVVALCLAAPAAGFGFGKKGAKAAPKAQKRSSSGAQYPSVALPWTTTPLDGSLVGDVGFDPLGFTEILPLAWLREAEIKHCRTAMLATFGFAFTDFWHFPGFDYTTLEAHDAVIAQGGMSQLLLWIGLLEVFSAISIDQMLRGSGREPGDYGFDPLGFASDPAKKADLQMKELANGRLAMFAFGGFVTQSVLTGNTFPYLFDYQTAGDIVAIAAQGASP